ncbi:MAG: hypothetical protein ABSH20_31355, partial [Tepidisphaeraceae bacterium]
INATANPPYNPANHSTDSLEWAIFNLDDKTQSGNFVWPGITSENTKLIVLEDMTGQSNNDKDYDDMYIVVGATAGDLDTDADNDVVDGTPDANPNTAEDPLEDVSPGKYIAVQKTVPATGNADPSTRFVPMNVTISDAEPGVTKVRFVYDDSSLQLWTAGQPGVGSLVANGTAYTWGTGPFNTTDATHTTTLYVEALATGTSHVQLQVDPLDNGTLKQVDEVEFTTLNEHVGCLTCERGIVSNGAGGFEMDDSPVPDGGDVSADGPSGKGVKVGAPVGHLLLCGNAVAVKVNDQVAIWDYRTTDGTWQPREPDKLGTMEKVGDTFVETDLAGTTWTYMLADDSPLNGVLTTVKPATGGEVDYFYDANGRITKVKTTTADNHKTVATFTYDANGNAHESVQNVVGSDPGAVSSGDFTYYAAAGSHGSPGDLEFVQSYDASGNPVDTTYYRYYEGTYSASTATGYQAGANPGQPDDFKFVLQSAAVQRAMKAYSLTDPSQLDSLTDAQLVPYADDYFKYDSAERVIERDSAASGCSCAGGVGATTYAYSFSNLPDEPNNWYDQKTETRADGSTVTTLYDSASQVILQDTWNGKSGAASQHSITYNEYDASGNLIYAYQPSAVTGWSIDGSTGQLDVSLNATAGLVQVSAYYDLTAATTTAAGGVAGWLQASGVQEGSEGTPVWQSSLDYIA